MHCKTIFNILCLLLISINVQCQVVQTVPLNSIDLTNGTYYKDIENELSFWVGTWEGISDDKKYIFEFAFFQQHLNSNSAGSYNYYDEIKGKLKVIDLSTNVVLYDNLNVVEYNDYRITNVLIRGNRLLLLFQDDESNCCNTAEFYLIKNNNTPNQIIYKDFSYREYGCLSNQPCPYADQLDIPMFLPKVDLVLTRQ